MKKRITLIVVVLGVVALIGAALYYQRRAQEQERLYQVSIEIIPIRDGLTRYWNKHCALPKGPLPLTRAKVCEGGDLCKNDPSALKAWRAAGMDVPEKTALTYSAKLTEGKIAFTGVADVVPGGDRHTVTFHFETNKNGCKLFKFGPKQQHKHQ